MSQRVTPQAPRGQFVRYATRHLPVTLYTRLWTWVLAERERRRRIDPLAWMTLEEGLNEALAAGLTELEKTGGPR